MRVFSGLVFEHNLWLVLLAALMCVLGSTVTIRLYRGVLRSDGAPRQGWLFLTSVCAGVSIWTTHFIAMLGYQPPAPVVFDPVLTMVSGLIAIGGSAVAFWVASSAPGRVGPALGGALLGLAMAAMHFAGMFAYRVDGVVVWSDTYIAASIVLACLFGASALAVVKPRSSTKWEAASPGALLVLGIVALHFIGMAAFQVSPLEGVDAGANSEAFRAMALAVAVAGLIVIGTGVSSYLIDTRRIEQSDEQLRHMALHDALTGLPNRLAFNDELAARIGRGRSLAVIGIDLNRFKEINDAWGHEAGDKVLCELARRLRQVSGERHFPARFGGDEFALIAAFDSEEALQDLTARIERAFNETIRFDHVEVSTGASLGVAVFARDGASPETLVRNADLAMYKAKLDPLESVCFYDAALGEKVRERRMLASDLRNAIARNELALHYQIQTSISTGDVIGYEALLRWTHPERGLVPPATFIPLAEANGLILPLGEWVLRRACTDAVAWRDPLKVAVNLSAIQLTHAGLPRQIHQILIDTGLAPERLEIELTETALIKDKAQSLHVMRQIKALGVGVALDDFGAGYSSLDTLRSFPFDKIKLDKSFTDALTDDERTRAVIRAVLSMARTLSIPVLAEGIETERQLNALREESCDEAQGFLLGRPAPLDAATMTSRSAPVARMRSA